MFKNKLYFILLFILAIPSLVGLLHRGFFVSDDANWMIIRFSAFYEALRNGQFPVRFLPRLNSGYGYPVADFLYPLFMYLGVPIHILGFNFTDTIKVILGFSMVGSGLFAFFWLRRFFSYFPSLVGSLFYLYTPYHLFDIYKRGSVGEVLAISILPFILWQIERRSLLWAGLGLSLMVLSHNSLAILFFAVVILYLLICPPNKNKPGVRYFMFNVLYLMLIGLSLSAFFWLPALYDLRYTVFLKTQVSDWARYFADINLIGLSTIAVFLLTLFLILAKKINPARFRLTMLFFALGAVSIFLSAFPSFYLWRILPVPFIQFPFRFLSVTIPCVSFLASAIVSVLPGRQKITIGILFLVLLFFSSWHFLLPKHYQYYPDSYYSTNQGTTTVKNEYMPKWVRTIPQSMPSSKVEIIKGRGRISDLIDNGNSVRFNINNIGSTIVQANIVYFPGWVVRVDGRAIKPNYKNGLIDFSVGSEAHRVGIIFEETGIRLFSDLISVFAVLAFLALMVFRKRPHL
ncbi:hypothetical protein M1615_04020 [Patescibacteria group bacterium]|nr:hypothetical protein [Patescibacteria group bacterium]